MPYIYYATLVWTTVIFIGSLGIVIYLGSQKFSSRIFAFNILLIVIWSIAVSLLPLQTNSFHENLLLKFTFSMGAVIAGAFFYFCNVFPDENAPRSNLLKFIVIFEILFNIILFGSDLIIGASIPDSSFWNWGQNYGPFWFIFDISFLSFWIGGVILLYNKFKRMPNSLGRKNIGYMLIGLIVGFIPPNICSILLPRLGIFHWNWLGPVSGGLWVCIIAYSILRYRQMDVRAVVTEVLAIAMTAIFFLNIFIDTPFGIWGKIAAFLAFLILAYYLIRGVLREARQREQLNDLNQNLEVKVAAQTVEIRRSLEAEKQARMELEKLNDAKDQFIMITQHHLRTPVSSVNWSLESILNGEYGAATGKLKSVLEQTYESGKRLMRIVDDFLNITAIKIGTNILNLEQQSLKTSIDDILSELKPAIASANISVAWDSDPQRWPSLPIDASKLREALFIIFENAIRYNTDGGSVNVGTETVQDEKTHRQMFEITITNTGLGISRDDIGKIGTSLFYRSEFARKAYPIGMGVGLSVVKAMIRAHQGSFTITSAGPGTGVRVIVTLPFVRQAIS
jgi:signal transduction histidine kinase